MDIQGVWNTEQKYISPNVNVKWKTCLWNDKVWWANYNHRLNGAISPEKASSQGLEPFSIKSTFRAFAFSQAWRCLEVHLSLYIIVCHFSQLLTLTQHKIALTPLERSLELSAAVFPSFVAIFFAEVSKAQVSEALGRSEVEASVDRSVKHWAEPCLANPLCISHIVHPYLSYGARLRWRLFPLGSLYFNFEGAENFPEPTSLVEVMAMLVYQLKQDFAISITEIKHICNRYSQFVFTSTIPSVKSWLKVWKLYDVWLKVWKRYGSLVWI